MFQSDNIEFDKDHDHSSKKSPKDKSPSKTTQKSPLKSFKEKQRWVATPKVERVQNNMFQSTTIEFDQDHNHDKKTF